MVFRTDTAGDPLVEALECLRTVDRLLDGKYVIARTWEPSRFAGLMVASAAFSLSPVNPMVELEAQQDEDDLLITEALGQLHRAVNLAGGVLWNGGISAQGVPWALHTSVGLRDAAREYFARLVASAPARLGHVPSLALLDPKDQLHWYASTAAARAFLGVAASAVVLVGLLAGVHPLAFVLVFLVAMLVWFRGRRVPTRRS